MKETALSGEQVAFSRREKVFLGMSVPAINTSCGCFKRTTNMQLQSFLNRNVRYEAGRHWKVGMECLILPSKV